MNEGMKDPRLSQSDMAKALALKYDEWGLDGSQQLDRSLRDYPAFYRSVGEATRIAIVQPPVVLRACFSRLSRDLSLSVAMVQRGIVAFGVQIMLGVPDLVELLRTLTALRDDCLAKGDLYGLAELAKVSRVSLPNAVIDSRRLDLSVDKVTRAILGTLVDGYGMTVKDVAIVACYYALSTYPGFGDSNQKIMGDIAAFEELVRYRLSGLRKLG